MYTRDQKELSVYHTDVIGINDKQIKHIYIELNIERNLRVNEAEEVYVLPSLI